MTPTIPEAAVQTATLWCVNIKGPDDIISAPDHLSAVRMANTFNAWWLDLITKAPLTDNHPRMWAEPIEWPYSEGHGEDVTDPNNEYQWLRELTEQTPSPRAQALEEAAQFIDKRASDYVQEHGVTDPETGTVEFPGWGDEYVSELEELAEDVRALSSHPVSPDMGVERPVEGGWLPVTTGLNAIGYEIGGDYILKLSYDNLSQFEAAKEAIRSHLPASPGATATLPNGGSDADA